MSRLILGYPKHSQGTGGASSYPFDERFTPKAVTTEEDLDGVDALVFWGGEDIYPGLYKEAPSHVAGTFGMTRLGRRDMVEVPLFQAAVKKNVPILGVCRGAQLVCALSGGKLVQHVNHHAGQNHGIVFDDGSIVDTSSVHHQMMYPFDMTPGTYKIVARSVNNRSDVYVMNDLDIREKIECEPEIVYFPQTRALAIQGHPEFMNYKDPFVAVCNRLVKEYLL